MDPTRMSEATDRRREPRYAVASGSLVPTGIQGAEIQGAGAHACLDWSRTGFRIAATAAGGPAELPPDGTPFDFDLAIVAALGRIGVKGTARILRRTPEFAAGTWTLRNPSGPNAGLSGLLLDAFLEAGPSES
jgi:hypothetical protein